MFEAQHSKQAETDQARETPEQKSTRPEQGIQQTGDFTQLPLYTQMWSNQPPPWLRLPVLQQTQKGEPLQRMAEQTQEKENSTGLPETLKTGIEHLSGLPMDDVNIHYNSSEPDRVQALAFTQGTDIHVGPGQQQHLPHEAWHVVQQKLGRVKPTLQAKGIAINNDEGLENEADVMGAMAAHQLGHEWQKPGHPVQRFRSTPVIQRRIHLKQTLSPALLEKIVEKLNAIAGAGKQPQNRFSTEVVVALLLRLAQAGEDYGLFDVTDEQQMEYLFYIISHIQAEPQKHPQAEEQPDQWTQLFNFNPDQTKVYKLAFVGVGSSVGYYLNAMGATYDHSDTLLLGKSDPWLPGQNVESRGLGYINHQLQLIAQWTDQVPDFRTEYADRAEFASQNLLVIIQVGLRNWRMSEVQSISKDQQDDLFIISGEGFTYKARKVIVGMGAGPHSTIEDVNAQAKGQPQRQIKTEDGTSAYIVDLDKFMRDNPPRNDNNKPGRGKTVIVHGPNAAIDPVERAKSLGYDVIWFISNTPPQFLKGQQLLYAPSVVPRKVENVKIAKSEGGKQLSVSYTEINAPGITHTEKADLYILALGQSIRAKGAAGQVISRELVDSLEAMYDKNLLYGDKPYETVLGLQTPGTTREEGLEIIGAAAFPLAGSVQHNYNKKLIEERTRLMTFHQHINRIDRFISSIKDDKKQIKLFLLLHKVADKMEILGPLSPLLNAEEALKQATEEYEKATVYMRDLSRDEEYGFPEAVDVFEALYAAINSHKTYRIAYSQESLTRDLEAMRYFSDENIAAREKQTRQRGAAVEMMRQVEHEAASVIVPPQLTTTRSAVGAVTSVMPRYVTRGANFSADNRTVLRVHLASRYPNIQETDAQYLIGEIIDQRRLGFHPLGYYDWWNQHWQDCLAWWNAPHTPGEKSARKGEEMSIREQQNEEELRIRTLWITINGHLKALLNNPETLKSYLRNYFTKEQWSILWQAYTTGVYKSTTPPFVEVIAEGILTPEQKTIILRALIDLLLPNPITQV